MVDPRELARFVLGGTAGATANLTGTYVARGFTEYRAALLVGLAIGFVVSFLAARLAFRARSRVYAPGELARFVAVYAAGTGCALAVSVAAARGLVPALPMRAAELGGAFCGSATMAATSYLGHRFFTFRSARGGGRSAANSPRVARAGAGGAR